MYRADTGRHIYIYTYAYVRDKEGKVYVYMYTILYIGIVERGAYH